MRLLRRGQSTVEFALICIPLFLLIVGLFDLGRATYHYHMISSAVREGARAGITGLSVAEVCALTVRKAFLPDVPANPVCTTSGGSADFLWPTVASPDLNVQVMPGTSGNPNDPVKVTLAYKFRLVTPLIGSITGESFTLTARSAMYAEQIGPTPTPGPSSTPNTTPTPPLATSTPPATATNTPSPTPTQVPAPCTVSVVVPNLQRGTPGNPIAEGYFFTFTSQATGGISAVWTFSAAETAGLYLYVGNPFGPGSNPRRANPPPGALVSDASGPAKTSYGISSGASPAGQYTVYFHNRGTSNLPNNTNGQVTYMKSGCP